ncbi:hypothetical protein SAMN04489760_10745 [Syntrophus gentianae]|uniref:Uncharacterized protein n=2 Tax=Syntrophus gentianae TaxID=43775 RepID=A0A1H7WNJ5_9BACT|nr:hypothetical protein SAMN04489760_10745 [Syntrophus gentianae]
MNSDWEKLRSFAMQLFPSGYAERYGQRNGTMKIAKNSIVPFDFEGLQIIDYTSKTNRSSSIAEIMVLPGASHPKAYSNRSVKY